MTNRPSEDARSSSRQPPGNGSDEGPSFVLGVLSVSASMYIRMLIIYRVSLGDLCCFANRRARRGRISQARRLSSVTEAAEAAELRRRGE